MRTTHSGPGAGLANGCGCSGAAQESWSELEAYPASGWSPQPPAFLGDSEEWSQLYRDGLTYQDGVRMLLGPEGESLTDPEVDLLLERITDSMDAAQAAEFLGGIGRALQGALPVLGQVAQAALPIVGGAVGSMVAPGIGTALGGALGSAAGRLVGQAAGRAGLPPAQPAPMAPMRLPQSLPHLAGAGHTRPFPGPMTIGAARPAQQLLGLLQNPQLLGGLANAALGGAGVVPGGGAALLPLLGTLARLAEGVSSEISGEALDSFDGDAASALAHSLVQAVQGGRR